MFFFFNDTATTEIYTLSLHDALPISPCNGLPRPSLSGEERPGNLVKYWARDRHLHAGRVPSIDRKSTRLNSSHLGISYAVFCLKKKNDTLRRRPALYDYCRRHSTDRF